MHVRYATFMDPLVVLFSGDAKNETRAKRR